jgi:hypothetical protein
MTLLESPNIASMLVIKSKQTRTWSIQQHILQGTKAMFDPLLRTTQEGS